MRSKSSFQRAGRAVGALLCVFTLLLAVRQNAWAQPTQDFGDAPTPYPTTLKDNGARHTVTGPLLGFARDAESDGQPNSFAQGDDNNGDDEDGVSFVSLLVPGQVAIVEVTLSGAATARLDAWMDFGRDGSWSNAVDRIFSSRTISNGVNTLAFVVPAGSSNGTTFARFRVSANGDLNYIGSASNGEVEDYQVSITDAADFGDAPTKNYPTLLSQNGARHRVVQNFMLGTKIDSEPDGQPNAAATGDDLNPSTADDEDGVNFTSVILAGSNATVEVFCTLPAGLNGARLNAWMDFNANGDWADAGEHIFTDVAVVAGVNKLSFAVPSTAAGGLSFARFRLNANGKIGFGGSTSEGEVEDYQVSIIAAQDFGDAPKPYPTLLADNGARHNFTNTFCLGTVIDGETDGQPDAFAKGDDANPPGAASDEDGVTATSSFVPGQAATVTVFLTGAPGTAGPAGVLNAWVDFNADGDWNDAGEQIFADQALAPGANNLSFLVPVGAKQGPTYARFRLNHQGRLTPTGPASDGEVEDYRVNITPDLDFGDAPAPYPTLLADNGARHGISRAIHLGPIEDSEPDGQPNTAANGDDINPPQVDDEDGVYFLTPLIQGSPATVRVLASAPGLLHAWIDFGIDGSWAEAGDKVFSSQAVSAGTNDLVFNVPATAKSGRTYARFRYTTVSTPVDFVGEVSNGEVEDYVVSVITDRERCDHNCDGKEYWLTYPGNYAPDPDNPARLSLCLKGSAGTAANVSVPGIGFSTNVVIPASQALMVPLPRAAELGNLVDVVTNLGIHVVSSAPISITGYNHARYTTDSFMALNASVIGTRYIVMGYGNTQSGVPPLNGTQFGLVATESNTIVAIRPTADAGGRTAGVPYLMILQPGDAYQLRSTNDTPADLSGTLILSDKPIAVFGGHQCANVPSSNVWFCDYLVEQLLPVNTWGNDFYTARLATRSGGDTFRILAAQNNTTVLIGGTLHAVLNLAQFSQVTLTTNAHIQSDKPIFVTQYANSGDFDGNLNADPFMLTVPATRHYLPAYRICTPTNDFPTNFLAITIPSGSTNTLFLDGVAIPGGLFSPIPGTSFAAGRVQIAPGNHLVTGGALFGATVYGWAEYDSYGHPACMYFGDVVAPTIAGVPSTSSASVNDYPNTPGFVPAPNFASAVTVQDNCDQQPRTPQQDPPPRTLIPPGVHTFTVSVPDANGNIGETNVTFTVVDPSAVVIDCPSNIVVGCQADNGAIVQFAVTAHSTYDTNVPVVSTPPSGSFFPAGVTVVTNVATSLAGNTDTCYFTVTVLCNRTIGISNGSKNVTLTWEGNATLEFAPNVNGPWSNVVSGVSRYVVPLTGQRGFYRVRY